MKRPGTVRAMLIFNPAAGWRAWKNDLLDVVDYFSGHGWDVTWRETWGPGDATILAREAADRELDVALVAGGDGTVSEVVNGLVNTEVVLGVLPTGTGNVWAREMKLPMWGLTRRGLLEEAAARLLRGQCRRVDVGRAGPHHFLLWAGVGLDAKVTEAMEPRSRVQKWWGPLAYAVALAAAARDYKGTSTKISIDGKVFWEEAIVVLISNAQLYGGAFRLSPQAQLDDGLFDVSIFKGHDWASTLSHARSILTGQYMNGPEVAYCRGRRVAVETEVPLPVQFDGDTRAMTPLEVEVVPQALNVMVPRDIPEGLFVGRQSDNDGHLEPTGTGGIETGDGD